MSLMKSVVVGVTLLFASLSFAGQVDINTADAQTLAENLQGIGPSKAEAIVSYRTEHGKFESVDDLKQIKGIGEATIEQNRKNLLLKP